ncbi:MAG: hypothetical protein ACOYY2_09645 [Actinomycetota bacterium]
MRLPGGPWVRLIALGVLLVLDVVLVAAVVGRSPAAPPAQPLPSGGLVGAGQPTQLPPTTPAPPAVSPTPTQVPPPPRALPLDLAADGTALRALAPGGCPGGGARLQWSGARGAQWRDIPSPAALVLRVRVVGAGVAWLVGGDQGCQLRLWSTSDAGRSWAPGDPAAAWSLLPPPQPQLHAPQRLVAAPCGPGVPAVDLVGLTPTRAALLCPNGGVYVTQDTGATWQATATVPGARAVAVLPSGAALVLRFGADGCNGFAVDGTQNGSGVRMQGPGKVRVGGR